MSDNGWIKLHRKVLNNPVVCKDAEHIAVWMYLLLNATHEAMTVLFGGEKITLKSGQLLTSRNTIAKQLKINPSKVYRILSCFKIEQQIEQVSNMQQSLITISNWDFYQCESEQANEQRVNNDRTTVQEKEKTKKKSFPPHPLSKEKIKENKETDKNVISVCSAHTHEDTHSDLVVIGKYENVRVSQSWLSAFRGKYTYANSVIEALSRYKATHNLINDNDVPFLESFAEQDKDKYQQNENSTFDADDFFEAALRRSYQDMED